MKITSNMKTTKKIVITHENQGNPKLRAQKGRRPQNEYSLKHEADLKD